MPFRILAAFLSLWLAVTPAWAGSMTLLGVGAPAVSGGGALAVDANVNASAGTFAGTTVTNTITTTATNEIVLVLIALQAGTTTVTGVSGSSLGAFTQRASANRFSSQRCYVYWKIASSTVTSEVITVTFSASGAAGGLVNTISIEGVNTSSPFDPNGSLPNLVGAGGAGGAFSVVSTTNSNTIAYAINFDSTTQGVSSGAGFTLLANGFSGVGEYKSSGGSAFSSLSMTTNDTAANNDCAIGDAVTQ